MEKTPEKENIMGTMPEGRLLLKLALPMIFSVLVSSLYNIVDSIFDVRISGYSACLRHCIQCGLIILRNFHSKWKTAAKNALTNEAIWKVSFS